MKKEFYIATFLAFIVWLYCLGCLVRILFPTPLPKATMTKAILVTPPSISRPTPTASPLPKVEGATTITPTQYALAPESHMLTLVNQQRAAYGLRPLVELAVLDYSALLKAEDLQKEYNAHPSAITINHTDSYGRWFGGFFTDAGFYNRGIAENLAQDYPNDVAVMQAWMNSPEHRANILGSQAVYFGYAQVGIFEVAHFGADW